MEAEITNALIRCTRADQLAQPAFELVREDLNLWVRELPETMDDITHDLFTIRSLLRKLRSDSSDYTLHLAAEIDELHSLALPPGLTEIASDCGFTIELIVNPR
jgi:hypothetical protein